MDTSSKYTSSTINNKKLDDIFAKQYDNCIIGSGLSGSVIAQQYSTFNQSSLIIEKRSHIGGNCYDTIDSETGIRISLYGAHLFHTNSDRVWNYVQQFGHWVNYEHKVLGLVNGKYVPIPVNIDTVNALFDLNISTEEEMKEWLIQEQVLFLEKDGTTIREPKDSEEVALTRVGERLYELIFKPYTWKQWAKYPKELGPEVLSRIPVRSNHDGRYFSDRYQALPQNGYTSLFENMLDWGGVYVIEDIECSYWNPNSTIYGYTVGEENIIDHFVKLNHSVNNNYSNHTNDLHIKSISYYPNCIVIEKYAKDEIRSEEYRFKHLL